MALFPSNGGGGQTPPPPPTVTPKAPASRIEHKGFRGITIDTEYAPSSSLLTYIAGSNWTVDYFSQVLNTDNEPGPQNLDRDAIYQQYRRIRGMDLKVTTPLSFSQDSEVLTMQANGSGITYPFLVPNKGDMFIADIGDGTIGLFTITSAERATILRDSVYNIDFTMVSRLSEERMSDLERKTIQEFRYSRDSLLTGCGPFVTEGEYNRSQRYARIRDELLSRYLADFYSHQFQTLLVPDQHVTTYDHFVVKAFLKMVSSDNHRDVRKVRELNVSAEPVMKVPTIWDAVVRRDGGRLYGGTKRTLLYTTSAFKGRVTLQALGFTGIKRVVFPVESPTDIDSWYNGKQTRAVVGMPYSEGKPRRMPLGILLPQMERGYPFFMRLELDEDEEGVEPWRMPPDIHPVVKDEYYVLTEAFYQGDTLQMSKLELLVSQLIESKSLNLDQLDALLESLWDWDNLERFYYYPLVWALLTVGMRAR